MLQQLVRLENETKPYKRSISLLCVAHEILLLVLCTIKSHILIYYEHLHCSYSEVASYIYKACKMHAVEQDIENIIKQIDIKMQNKLVIKLNRINCLDI